MIPSLPGTCMPGTDSLDKDGDELATGKLKVNALAPG